MSGRDSLVVEGFPARDQALKLLDELCQDSLECSLDVIVRAPIVKPEGNIAAKFRWLHDLIVDMAHELADADFSRDLQFKAANLHRERADRAEALLRRIAEWDALQLPVDQPYGDAAYWQREIAKVLGG